MKTAVQVSMYLNEEDPWNKVLELLHSEQLAGASAFHAVAGFVGRNLLHRASLVEAGGKVPVLIIFVDLADRIERVLPKVMSLVPERLVVREKVQIEQGSFE